MRKATVAKLSLTALVGICSFVGSANIAAAGPGPQQGSIKVAPTTSTTMKPLAEPADYCDSHLCLEADEVDPSVAEPTEPKGDVPAVPQAEEACPSTAVCPPDDPCRPVPGAADCPKEDPCDDDDGPQIPRSQIDECDPCDDGPKARRVNDESGQQDPCDPGDPCKTDDRPEDPPRSRIEDCDPCIDLPDGGTLRHEDTGGDDCGGTDGTTGGTDGDSRLPKTGGDIMTLAGMGLGLTGIGVAVKRLGRRTKEDQA